jgi:hypothetical protein
MNRLDTIIDALEKAKDGWQCFDEYEKALAAARELRELKPVGMASQHITNGAALFDGVVLPEETLLYALDEVTK